MNPKPKKSSINRKSTVKQGERSHISLPQSLNPLNKIFNPMEDTQPREKKEEKGHKSATIFGNNNLHNSPVSVTHLHGLYKSLRQVKTNPSYIILSSNS